MKTINLPSGAELVIQLAPFADADRLNKAVAKELKALKIDAQMELEDPNFIKDLVCAAISSDEIMAALWVCFKRCTYNGQKISVDSFEPEEARGDYYPACREVLVGNCLPFFKSLLSQLKDASLEKKAESK